MITASHNPKADNGYKLYWHNGCQIIEPHDVNISNHIQSNLKVWDNVKSEIDKLLATPVDQRRSLLADKIKDPEHVITHYFQDIKQYSFNGQSYTEEEKKKHEKIVFTAMHGVGAPFVARAFESFNLNPYVPVVEQIDPNPDFPTVTYPNPEEGKGALALSIATADKAGSRLILANDPDADRLAVAEKQDNGEWRIFNGNEIAFLLAHWVWIHFQKSNPNADYSKCVMIASTVSSKILRAMAQKEGFKFEETLTGFKWIGNKADDSIREGYTFLFGYEVEIGFLVGDISLDKDGIRSASVFAEMAQELYQRENYNLGKHLDALYSKYGYYMMKTRYFFVPSPSISKKIFDEIRTMENNSYPTQISYNNKTYKIRSVRDLTVGYDNAFADKKPVLPIQPDAQMITFNFEDDENGGTAVCTLRNSGTEPKLKWYVEVSDHDKERATSKVQELTTAVIETLIKPSQNNLQAPTD
jgi:phosphomannomutase